MQTALALQIPANLKKLYIAYSGGIDSSVLLHALQHGQAQYEIIVWHIHHGLQGNADEFERFACEQAALYGLPYRVDYLKMDRAASNLEARARTLRYQLFAQALGRDDALLTAHHQNDQAETLLLNLMRGSGSAGLRGIANSRPLGQGLLLRPLLEYSRNQLEDYATANQLQWIDDPSNADDRFDRNFLRHQVLPRLIERWPAAVSQLQRASQWQQESEQLLQQLAHIDLEKCRVEKPFAQGDCLRIDSVRLLPVERQKNLIRHWISEQGYVAPGYRRLQELLQQLSARQDAQPRIDGEGYSLRCYRQCLYLLEQRPPVELECAYQLTRNEELRIEAIQLRITRAEILQRFQRPDHGQQILIKFRRPHKHQADTHSHRLKRLFQCHQVPPWLREQIPQVMIDNELAGLFL